MIPQEYSAAVTRALSEAFDVTAFEDIRVVTGGHTSSLVYRIVVRGEPYLLKIIPRKDDPSRHYASMRSAADAGLAPRVWYTNVEDKVSITGFVPAVPRSRTDVLIRIPAVLRALHALPPFGETLPHINTTCTYLFHKGPAVEGFLQKFRASGILPPADSENFFNWYAQILAAYPLHHPDPVSSHNDLFKPDNILFDGNRLWLVDWEAAFFNDRYAELAVVANLVVANEAEEAVYLQEYFGQPPNEYQLARFYLMQQLSHLFYAMGFLYLGSLAAPVNFNDPVPDFHDYQQGIWAGEVDLSHSPTKIVYGRVHWNRLVKNMQQTRFNEAVEILSARQACP